MVVSTEAEITSALTPGAILNVLGDIILTAPVRIIDKGNIVINGNGHALDGQGSVVCMVITHSGQSGWPYVTMAVTLNDLTLRNGNGEGFSYSAYNDNAGGAPGGIFIINEIGIYNTEIQAMGGTRVALEMNRCNVVDNRGSSGGGLTHFGMFTGAMTLSLNECDFQRNIFANLDGNGGFGGAAVQLRSGTDATTTVTLRSSNFSRNAVGVLTSTYSVGGGGIFVNGGSIDMAMISCVVSENSIYSENGNGDGVYGAGMFIYSVTCVHIVYSSNL